MGLHPLEFSECFTDSPHFREKLHTHEKELERTSKAIKGLITEVKELVRAAKDLSKAQRSFSTTLTDFRFECLGVEQTDDEVTIGKALKQFGALMNQIEDERDRMLQGAYDEIVHSLDSFRKERIGGAKDGKKKFDRQTAKFCQSLEKYLSLKSKTNDNLLQEADAGLQMEQRYFYSASMQYVLLLQEVQERKKFEFVESLLLFMYSWLTFYHQGHDIAGDFKPYMTDLQLKLQKCRTNFDTTHEQAETLMRKKLEVRGAKPHEHTVPKTTIKEGYLFIMEKKALTGTSWVKNYCIYQKENKILSMIPYNQIQGKGNFNTDTVVLDSCTRRASDSIDKRFCFDISVQSEKTTSLTLQALSEDDYRMWLAAMDGKEPIYSEPSKPREVDSSLDDIGFQFINKCIKAIESRGLSDEGLYRVVGVNSKVSKLVSMGLDRRKIDKLILDDHGEWEVKTITSALKNYFRSLPEPITTFRLHNQFIIAAKQQTQAQRVHDVHSLVNQLPKSNYEMLNILVQHLKRVTSNSSNNKMPISNIGVCFGPTLMRSEEETISSIMDIKFCNIVVEIILEHSEKIFSTSWDCRGESLSPSDLPGSPVKPPLPQGAKPTLGGKPALPARPTSMLNNYAVNSNVNSHATGGSFSHVTGGSTSSGSTSSDRPSTGSTSSVNIPPSSSQQLPHQRKFSTSSLTSVLSNSSTASTPTTSASGAIGGANNSAPQQTYAQYKAKLRPTGSLYSSHYSPGDHTSSTSSSSESLNSKSSALNSSNPTLNTAGSTTPTPGDGRRNTVMPSMYPPLSSALSTAAGTNNSGRFNPPNIQKPEKGLGYNLYRKRKSADSVFSILMPSSSTSSLSSISSGPGSQPSRSAMLLHNKLAGGKYRKVRTLYSCDAENGTELSFDPNQIIYNVKTSREPGWLEGTLDGKTGLIPANYVEYVD